MFTVRKEKSFITKAIHNKSNILGSLSPKPHIKVVCYFLPHSVNMNIVRSKALIHEKELLNHDRSMVLCNQKKQTTSPPAQ
jgi:hypothetical protein